MFNFVLLGGVYFIQFILLQDAIYFYVYIHVNLSAFACADRSIFLLFFFSCHLPCFLSQSQVPLAWALSIWVGWLASNFQGFLTPAQQHCHHIQIKSSLGIELSLCVHLACMSIKIKTPCLCGKHLTKSFP